MNSAEYGVVKGRMTRINLAKQQAWLDQGRGNGAWVALDLIRKKYGT